jgi:hypothetical protein
MTIFTKALQLALEAMQEGEVDLANAIVNKINLAKIGADSGDQDSVGYLIKTFIDLGLFSAAAKTAIYALRHSIELESNLCDSLQYELSRRGQWAEHNEILELVAEYASNEKVEQWSHHLLNQLEIKKASTLLAILRKRPGLTIDIEAVALLVARREYELVEQSIDINSEIIDTFIHNDGLRHWLYLFLAYAADYYVKKTIETLAEQDHNSYSTLDNYAHLLKSCWAVGKQDFCAIAISNIPTDLNSELLRRHLVFCRAYVFTCQKLGVSNALSTNLSQEKFGVFSEQEIWAINLKLKVINNGPLQPIEETFGPINISKGPKIKMILPLIIYGSDYIRAFRELFVESALAAADFLELADRFEFIVAICTDPQSREEISQLFSPLKERGFILDIERALFPTEELPHKRMWFYVDALMTAELNEGYFLCMCPDAVFGDGFSKLVDCCPRGGGAGGGLMRASWSAMSRAVAKGELALLLQGPDKNRKLVTSAITNWSHYSHRLFFENLSENYVSRLHNGTRVNSWQGVPHVIRPDEGFTERLINRAVYRYSNVFGDHPGQDFDHDLVGALNEQGLLYMVESFEDFVFIEVAHDAGYSQLWKFQLPMGHELPTPTGETFPYVS